MSVSIERPLNEASARLLTAADLAAMPSELPSGSVDFELDNGRLVIVSPPGNVHGNIQARICCELMLQGKQRGFGKVYVTVGVVLWRDPDRVVGIDAGFVCATSCPIQESPEGYLETIPDLMIEIRSKNDRHVYVQQKVDNYLVAGAKVVWVVDPCDGTIAVYHKDAKDKDAESQVLTRQDMLTLDGIIPGFQLPVNELFKD